MWQIFADDKEVETDVQKWLRQQSKDFYAAGFDAMIKQWDKCLSVGGGYVKKYIFFSRCGYHMFYGSYQFVTYLLTLPHILEMEASDSSKTFEFLY
jgi:hypothetical protein